MLETLTRTAAATPYRRWVLACVLAETIGMTAAAGAATAGRSLDATAALTLVVAGGLVEGLALGWAQSRVLSSVAPRLPRARYVTVTTAVAGLGWTAASAPAALSGDSDAGQPPLLLVVAGAAGLGLVLGALLGAAQAAALRGAVPHPRRWVGANVAAWPLAMAAIFLGATAPSPVWPAWSVLALGAVTGAVAGALLGAVSGCFLPSLTGPSLVGRVVLNLLESGRRDGLGRDLIGLEVHGRVSGHPYTLPVQYAVAPGGLAVVPGRPERKTWWRNIGTEPTPVRVLREQVWAPGSARVVRPGDIGYTQAVSAYCDRWEQVALPADQPVVLVQLGGPHEHP